ncbi:hypothetical protein CS022_02070 [Veronia nyctiphanis]|uniref:YdbS-like PH domain-containing protein n=1 Tax=Veronia nyctiphanis TaxID=1278244 RepID=A0A4Q0YT78_9GAMM|nr:PH domain-containing protein [Veronia nyctiphanis]RXJ74416.1 hypothetical protein CS022_02070 [Veronia nyctiphanis]
MDTSPAFSNRQITDDELPSLQSLSWDKLSPTYFTVNIWLRLLTNTLIFAGSVALRWLPVSENWMLLITCLNVLCALAIPIGVIWGYFADKRIGFSLREQDISVRSGLVFRSIITQPMLRVQHVELTRGPIERKAGLATLEVFSAGGDSGTFSIPGLPEEKAKEIRQFILGHGDLTRHD